MKDYVSASITISLWTADVLISLLLTLRTYTLSFKIFQAGIDLLKVSNGIP